MFARFLCSLLTHHVNQEEKSTTKQERDLKTRIMCCWIITSHDSKSTYR
jgi:hypothetical protein